MRDPEIVRGGAAMRYKKVRIDKQFWVGVLAMSLLGASGAARPAAHAQEAPSPRVGHEAARALVGNTLVYSKPEQPSAETGVFLRLDGTGLAVTRGAGDARAPRAIRWANLSDGRFCISDAGRQPWDGDCGMLSAEGARATLTPKSGSAWSGRVLEGDAWQLDPAAASTPRLTGKAAIAALVGHTMIFVPEGGTREYRAHYLMPGGTARRAHNEQPDFDHWALQPDERWSIRGKDDQLCLSGGAWKEDFCAAVTVTGALVTLHDKRTGPLNAKLARGDARNLSPAIDAAIARTVAALTNHSMTIKAADRAGDTDRILYFGRGGIGLVKRGDGAAVPMKWLVQRDGKLCVAPRAREFRDSGCAALSIDRDTALLRAPDNPPARGQIVKGNVLTK